MEWNPASSYKTGVERFDVIIVGGGISGLGVARECTAAGLSTLLLEANECGGATSNNTLRIIHGGFRYLQNFDLPRLLQSLDDQTTLMRELPEAIKPLPCVMPLSRFGLKSRLPVTCAALMYGAFMRLKGSQLPVPRTISSKRVHSTIKALRERCDHGALCWCDGVMVDPHAVTQHLISQVRTSGGVIEERTPVEEVRREGEGFTVRSATGKDFCGRAVVNTLGPWLNSIALPDDCKRAGPAWCRGFNLVIKQQIDPHYGIGIESSDGRLFFCVPRGSGTALGTWYLPHPDISVPPTVSEHEIAQFLHAFNKALPGLGISKSDVVDVDVGILPMVSTKPGVVTLLAHEQVHAQRGYIEVLSTKYTTFRSQGQTVLGSIKRHLT